MSRADRLILGTAGHIDHGKTALVQALTGVDTDRLPEEKARGITIELGFALLEGAHGLRLGVVDVPGHEDFVRTMVAGATGMDVALLVIAADEGVMPQTREHLDIVGLLGVPALVVALTKVDLVDPEWLELVQDDVRDLLGGTGFAGATMVPTSSKTGAGIDTLRHALGQAARDARARRTDDLARLPVDRAFTVRGTGTVVTGTLWSGTLTPGERVRMAPMGPESRIRTVHVHGSEVPSARAGERTAIALTGVDRAQVQRGMTLVTGNAWADSWMLTVKARVLPHSAWPLETGQRVRVLLGTAEALARSAVLEAPAVAPGETGWVQLRLETPLLARAGDRVILRSYSPVTTLGGGEVAEPHPPKRKRLDEGVAEGLEALIRGDARSRLEAATELAGWAGVARADLPVRTGLTPAEVEAAVERLVGEGGLESKQRIFGAGITSAAAGRIAEEVDRNHREDPLSPSVALDKLRTALPDWASAGLADAVIGRMAERGVVELAEGGARRPGFVPTFTADQEEACGRLRSLYAQAGLAPPFLDELPPDLRSRMDLAGLIRHLERDGRLVRLDEGLLVAADVLRAAGESVTNELGGRTGLGPSDFRDVLPVSRRHLMPLLAFFDGAGVTVRKGPVRDVPDGR